MESKVSHGAKLADALSKAQGKFIAPKKTKKVDFTDKNGRRVKYNYADLADCIDAVKNPLAENGLSVVHRLEYMETGFGMKTSLVHSSGEFLETWYPLPDPAEEHIRPQEFGSALTFARRYSLCCLLGIASEEDDDGAAADPVKPPGEGNKPKQFIKKSSPPPSPHPEPHFDEPPIDEFDQTVGADEEPFTNRLERLYYLVDKKKIPREEVVKMIKLATNSDKKSTELSDSELDNVLNFINLWRPSR